MRSIPIIYLCRAGLGIMTTVGARRLRSIRPTREGGVLEENGWERERRDGLVPAYGFTPVVPDVVVLMSGGVDSTLAAWLLRGEGLAVAGVTMEHNTSSSSRRAAVAAAQGLAVPLYVTDLRAEFAREIIAPFAAEYAAGRTPNPCAECNRRIKFGLLWDRIERAFGPVPVATGHYARVERDGGAFFLARGRDESKDQSYFLAGIPRERLPRLLLPLGGRTKAEVRALAKSAGLVAAEDRESMEICFAGEADYRTLLGSGASEPGTIVDETGRVLGRHRGVGHYTVGQRKGLGIPSAEGLYVLRVDARGNRIVVGPRENALRRKVRARDLNVLIPELLTEGTKLLGRIRSNAGLAPCRVERYDEKRGLVEVLFDEPQFAPTPGQRLVVHSSGGRVAAGGILFNGEEEPWT